ncbi:hypothetical protein MKW94_014805 [Papaver nudicaule]|uniref:Urease accessory protein D n=2 Tax=Papaver nudicaule TaxID=74823 RepID=A0AA41RYQ8_PAPNU|nr:hypothetical protein [Papaver nudicaule]
MYSQKQIFRMGLDSSLLIVDWITSGRHESGEKWDFKFYKSSNNIYLEDDQPLFLDSVLLEQGSTTTIVERMQNYQVIAMVILVGPKLKNVQNKLQDELKRIMCEQLYMPSTFGRGNNTKSAPTKPTFVASCSAFGPKGVGLVVRIAATTTESVYKFLQHQLAIMEPLLGVSPYC